MGFKLTKKNLRKIVLQEIRKLTEFGGFGEEEEDRCPDGMVWDEDLRDCVEESEGIDPVHQERPDAGEGWGPEKIEDLASELERMGFVRR